MVAGGQPICLSDSDTLQSFPTSAFGYTVSCHSMIISQQGVTAYCKSAWEQIVMVKALDQVHVIFKSLVISMETSSEILWFGVKIETYTIFPFCCIKATTHIACCCFLPLEPQLQINFNMWQR